MRPWLTRLPSRLFLIAMMVGTLLIASASLVYFDLDQLAPFVIEKLPVRFESLWLWSLRIHVASAISSFPLCLIAMMRFVQRRVRWHRWVGRLAGLIIMGGLIPSGVVLAFDAKGGLPVTAGFLLSAGILFVAMISGVVSARHRQMKAHAWAMRHVVAQMSVAVTSRAMLIGFDLLLVSPELAYVLALWVPVITSALIAEFISSPIRSFKFVPPQPNSRSLS